MKAMSRKEALSLGLKTFFSGNLCKYEHNSLRSVYNGTCLECAKRIGKKSYVKSQPRRSQEGKLDRRNSPEKYLVMEAKGRAKDCNVPHTLKPIDIVVPAFCPVLGIPLLVGKEHPKDNNPSIDRIIPALGYVKENVIVISTRANRIKNNSTVEELGKLYTFYRGLQDNGNSIT